MKRLALVALFALSACYRPGQEAAPSWMTQAEPIPPAPTDATNPMARVIWTLNYDVRELDATLAWLQTAPPSAERARAIGAAGLIGLAELNRPELYEPTLAAFDEAIPAFPDDHRLPLWREYLVFLRARNANDRAAADASLRKLRADSVHYKSFTLFGTTLGTAGYADATDEQLTDAVAAFAEVFSDTDETQLETDPTLVQRSRRIWDTPIAPYNLPATQAMAGELALRTGDTATAQVQYYTSINENYAYRWAWRGEVQRRLENLQAVQAGLNARPATEYMLGSHGKGALGVPEEPVDTRFGGRIGNGSCTICHSHVSVYDEGQPAQNVGFIRGRFAKMNELPNAQPVAFALPDGENPIPAGFGIGPFLPLDAPRDFDRRDELYDGTFLIPTQPGTWFVALRAEAKGQRYQGYGAREFGKQWFVDVRAGEITDISDAPIQLSLMKE